MYPGYSSTGVMIGEEAPHLEELSTSLNDLGEGHFGRSWLF
jgi:hypothetical protein